MLMTVSERWKEKQWAEESIKSFMGDFLSSLMWIWKLLNIYFQVFLNSKEMKILESEAFYYRNS